MPINFFFLFLYFFFWKSRVSQNVCNKTNIRLILEEEHGCDSNFLITFKLNSLKYSTLSNKQLTAFTEYLSVSSYIKPNNIYTYYL